MIAKYDKKPTEIYGKPAETTIDGIEFFVDQRDLILRCVDENGRVTAYKRLNDALTLRKLYIKAGGKFNAWCSNYAKGLEPSEVGVLVEWWDWMVEDIAQQ